MEVRPPQATRMALNLEVKGGKKIKENVFCCKQAAPESARAETTTEKNQHGVHTQGAACGLCPPRKRDGNELGRGEEDAEKGQWSSVEAAGTFGGGDGTGVFGGMGVLFVCF